MRDGVALLTWQSDTFAYAESFDEAAGRYRGLRGGRMVHLSPEDAGLLVKTEVARRQMDAEVPPPVVPGAATSGAGAGGDGVVGAAAADPSAAGTGSTPAGQPALARRYHGTVTLDPTRVGRDASRIADEVIAHLSGLVGADVRVTIEIDAEIPSGAPEHVVRTVTENGRTLKFTSQGFEKE
jgi:hypothetical protein